MTSRPHEQRAEQLFHEVVGLRTSDRAAYLDAHCPDLALRREVDELLAHADAEADRSRDAFESIFEVLATDLGEMSQISLRDILGDESPIALRPGSGEPELPERIGRYQVAGEIARGGVGSVWKARDTELGREIALKVLLDGHQGNPDATRRFVEEAQIGAQLQHPGIVPVHDMGLVADKKPYFAMKLVKGETLASLLSKRKNPSEDRQHFLGIFEQICQPLAYAHARGVIHRDLKPSNVMVGAFGEVQVMDWGLAKVMTRGAAADREKGEKDATEVSVIETVRSGSTGSESITGSVMGTPAYMPPEQARGEVEDLDERSDVFGLGAILCEILTGAPPYLGSTREEILRAAKKGYTEHVCARLDACDGDSAVVELTKSCLAAEPRQRPHDAGAIASAMRAYLSSLEEKARRLTLAAAQASIKLRAERKARVLTVALASTLLFALVVGGVWYTAGERSRQDRLSTLRSRFFSETSEAERRRTQARLSESTDEPLWSSAIQSATRAADIVRGEDPDLAARGEQLARDIRDEYRVASLLSRVDALLSLQSRGADTHFERAFGDYFGVDLSSVETARAVDLVEKTGRENDVAQALGCWWISTWMANEPRDQLLQIADDVDPTPWRRRLRSTLLDGVTPTLEAVASMFDRAEVTQYDVYLLIHVAVKSAGSDPSQPELLEDCLRTAISRSPGFFPPYLWLSERLLASEPTRREEALRLLLVGRTAAPKNPFAPQYLGQALAEAGDYGQALEAFAHGIPLRPGHAVAYAEILDLLRSHPARDFGSSLHRFANRVERLSTTVELISPRARETAALARALAHAERDEYLEAILELEVATNSSRSTIATRSVLDGFRERIAPDLVSYTSIDRAFSHEHPLVSMDADWSYHRGTREPSEHLEWTELGFDDRSWESGPAAFGYPGAGADLLEDMKFAIWADRARVGGTVLSDMRGRFTSLYLRKSFHLPEAGRVRALRLDLVADDQAIVYLNGDVVARERVPDSVKRLPFDHVAERAVRTALARQWQLNPSALRDGENVLAVHGLNRGIDDNDFALQAELVGEVDDAWRIARGRKRLDEFRTLSHARDVGRLISYFEARLLALEGRYEEAAERLRAIVHADPDATEPRVRLAECLRFMQNVDGASDELRSLASGDDESDIPIWNLWLAAVLSDPSRPLSSVLAELPHATSQRDPASARALPSATTSYSSSYLGEVRWLLETLDRGETARINCGDKRWVSSDGEVWESDRFFTGGSTSDVRATSWFTVSTGKSARDSIYVEERFFVGDDAAPMGYRFPVPAGRYRVTLHFVEKYFRTASFRVFDVLLEGRTELADYDTYALKGFRDPDVRPFLVEVRDGILDVEFRRRRENPHVFAIEIERVEP